MTSSRPTIVLYLYVSEVFNVIRVLLREIGAAIGTAIWWVERMKPYLKD